MDALNISGTTEDITDAANYLKNVFEMKDLGKTRFRLGIQWSTYHQKYLFINQDTLKKFLISSTWTKLTH